MHPAAGLCLRAGGRAADAGRNRPVRRADRRGRRLADPGRGGPGRAGGAHGRNKPRHPGAGTDGVGRLLLLHRLAPDFLLGGAEKVHLRAVYHLRRQHPQNPLAGLLADDGGGAGRTGPVGPPGAAGLPCAVRLSSGGRAAGARRPAGAGPPCPAAGSRHGDCRTADNRQDLRPAAVGRRRLGLRPLAPPLAQGRRTGAEV